MWGYALTCRESVKAYACMHPARSTRKRVKGVRSIHFHVELSFVNQYFLRISHFKHSGRFLCSTFGCHVI